MAFHRCRLCCADDPLIFIIMDKDTISYDDAIGSVLVSLKPLISGPEPRPSQISGWFPITDSLSGLRGEIKLTIRLKVVGTSPAEAAHLVSLHAVPRLSQSLYPYQFVLGFVEELVVRVWGWGYGV